MLLGQIELCCCALSLVLGLFVGISPISDKAKIRFMYVGAALSFMAVPNAAKPTSWCMPAPLSSRLARSVRISPSSSALYSKLTSLVVKDSCIRRCLGRKVSLKYWKNAYNVFILSYNHAGTGTSRPVSEMLSFLTIYSLVSIVACFTTSLFCHPSGLLLCSK